MNPAGIIPQYLAFTANLSIVDKQSAIRRALIIAAILLLSVCFLGSFLFSIFGITARAFKIAGGIILFFIAQDMLHVRTQRLKTSPAEYSEGVEKQDIAVFPLAIPLIAGPGSITTVLMLGEAASSFWQHLIIAVILLVVLFVLHFILRQAMRISEKLGTIGINVLTRLMGLILAAIAVQFVLDEITDIFLFEEFEPAIKFMEEIYQKKI